MKNLIEGLASIGGLFSKEREVPRRELSGWHILSKKLLDLHDLTEGRIGQRPHMEFVFPHQTDLRISNSLLLFGRVPSVFGVMIGIEGGLDHPSRLTMELKVEAHGRYGGEWEKKVLFCQVEIKDSLVVETRVRRSFEQGNSEGPYFDYADKYAVKTKGDSFEWEYVDAHRELPPLKNGIDFAVSVANFILSGLALSSSEQKT